MPAMGHPSGGKHCVVTHGWHLYFKCMLHSAFINLFNSSNGSWLDDVRKAVTTVEEENLRQRFEKGDWRKNHLR